MDNTDTDSDDNYIFNPLCYSKEDVENFIKYDCCKGTDNYSYIWCNSKYKDGKWRDFRTLHPPLDNLVDSTDLDHQEDRIRNRIKIVYDNIENINIFPLAENQEIIECSLNPKLKNPPIAFTTSHCRFDMYFDTLITCEKFENTHIPLHFAFTHNPKMIFSHSGDYRWGNILLHDITLNSNYRNCNNNYYDYYSGIYTIQGYNRKSLLSLRNCDPNLVIVDSLSDKLYIIPCPLSPTFVKNNHIAHMAYFEYIPHLNKIRWIIPKKPTFTNVRVNVGDLYQYYQPSVEQFMKNINQIRRKQQQQQREKEKEEEEEEEEMIKMDFEEEETTKYPTTSALIIQETLFYKNECKNMLDFFIKKEEEIGQEIYSFHMNIKKVDRVTKKPSSKLKLEEINAQYTIPIAGGSTISDHAIVMAGKRIENRKVAKTFSQFIYNYGKQAVIILSDDTKAANIPKVHSKINATFILVGLNIHKSSSNNNNIIDILNNIDSSLLVSMQGSLSRVVVYLPNKNEYFFYRGLAPYKLGDKIGNISEFLCNELVIDNKPPLIYHSSLNKVCIYSTLNEEYNFIVDIKNDEEQPSTILEKIIKCVYDIYNSKRYTIERVITEMQYICSQLEVWLHQTQITKMIERLVDEAEILIERGGMMFKMKDALQIILKNEKSIPHCPTKRIKGLLSSSIDGDSKINRPYNKKLLTRLIFDDNNDNDNSIIVNNIRNNAKLINRMNEVIKIYNENNITMKDWIEHLANILDNCVSLKTAYGKRIKGIEQRIRGKKVSQNVQKAKQMTEDDIDSLFQNECTLNGVLIVCLNTNNFSKIIENNNNDDDDYKKIIKRIPDFDRSDKDLASCYLPETPQSVLTFPYKDRGGESSIINTMLMIPCLKDIEAIFRDNILCDYNWRMVVEEGKIELVRIMLRNTVYQTIPQYIKNRYKIDSPSSEIVGNLLISILFGCLYSLKNINESQEEETYYARLSTDDFVIAFSRVLVGLILSIMASGVNVPLSMSYQIILGYQPTSFNFSKEERWLRNFLNVWPQTKIVDLPLKENILNCIYQKLNNKLLAIKGYEKVILKTDDINQEREDKIYWIRNAVRPLVAIIMKSKIDLYNLTEFKNIKKIDENVIIIIDGDKNRYFKPHIPFRPIPRLSFVPSVTKEKVSELLNEYSKVKGINEVLNNESHLFKHLAILEGIWNSSSSSSTTMVDILNNEDLVNIWNLLFACANDIYVKFSPEIQTATTNFINDCKVGKDKYITDEDKFIELKNIYISQINYWENPIFTNTIMPKYIKKLCKCNNICEFKETIKNMALKNPNYFYKLRKYQMIGKDDDDDDDDVVIKNRNSDVELKTYFYEKIRSDRNMQNMLNFYNKYSQKQFLCIASCEE